MTTADHLIQHPRAVSVGGAIATAAQDFVPPAELDSGLIKGNRWGQRTLLLGGPRRQFMVYDKDGINVLSCMDSPELAACKANARLEREAVPPEAHSPRLAGTRYGHRAQAKGNLLVHTVIAADGSTVLGESVDGRSAAAEAALTALCARVGVLDLSFEEFQRICPVARVSRGRGKSFGVGAVYDDEAGRASIRASLVAMRRCEILRSEGGSVGASLDGGPEFFKSLVEIEVGLLRQVARMDADVVTLQVPFEDGASRMIFAFTHGSMSKESIQRACYDSYLAECEAMQPVSAPRQRAGG